MSNNIDYCDETQLLNDLDIANHEKLQAFSKAASATQKREIKSNILRSDRLALNTIVAETNRLHTVIITRQNEYNNALEDEQNAYQDVADYDQKIRNIQVSLTMVRNTKKAKTSETSFDYVAPTFKYTIKDTFKYTFKDTFKDNTFVESSL